MKNTLPQARWQLAHGVSRGTIALVGRSVDRLRLGNADHVRSGERPEGPCIIDGTGTYSGLIRKNALLPCPVRCRRTRRNRGYWNRASLRETQSPGSGKTNHSDMNQKEEQKEYRDEEVNGARGLTGRPKQ
jgi:hypothetical protein